MSEGQGIDDTGNNDAEFWRLVLESHGQSGMSVSAFCRREGLSSSSFYNWQKRLTDKSRHLSGLSQAEPVVLPGIDPQPRFLEVGSVRSSRSQLRVTFPSGICVDACDGCDVKFFREAIDILVEKRC